LQLAYDSKMARWELAVCFGDAVDAV